MLKSFEAMVKTIIFAELYTLKTNKNKTQINLIY